MANPNPPLENLRPNPAWVKGQSGNPAGSSRKQRITGALLALLDEKAGGADRALAVKWLEMSLKGDPRFFAMLLERVEGKVVQPIANTGTGNAEKTREFLADDDGEDSNATGEGEAAGP